MVIFHGKLLNYLKGSQNWGDVTINKTCLQGIYLFASCPAHVYFQGPNCIHRWPNKCQRNNRRKVVPLQSWLSKKRTMKRPEPEPFHITVGVNLCISPQVGWKKKSQSSGFFERLPLSCTFLGKQLPGNPWPLLVLPPPTDQQLGAGYEQQSVSSSM